MRYFCRSPFCFTNINYPEQRYCTSCLLENQHTKNVDDFKETSKYWITRNDSSSVANILSGKWIPETYKTDVVETESKITNNGTTTEPLNVDNYKYDQKCKCSWNNYCTNSSNRKLRKTGCFCNICSTSTDKSEKFIRTKPLVAKNKKMKRSSTKTARKYESKSANQTGLTNGHSSTTWESGKFDCDLNCKPLSNSQKFKDNIIDHLDFTKDRRNLERGYMSDSNIHLCRCDLRNQHSQTSHTYDTLNARNDTNPKSTKCKSCNLRDLSDFRSYNYAETHAPKTITDTIKIPIHTCIYPFKLNDRLFAKNSFRDETYRCSICDLPLVTGITDFVKKPGSGMQNFEWEYIKKREIIRKRLDNFVPQMAVIQIPICVQEPNHSVIPQINGGSINVNQNSNGQQYRLNVSSLDKKKIYPRDSLALRFQKGMI